MQNKICKFCNNIIFQKNRDLISNKFYYCSNCDYDEWYNYNNLLIEQYFNATVNNNYYTICLNYKNNTCYLFCGETTYKLEWINGLTPQNVKDKIKTILAFM